MPERAVADAIPGGVVDPGRERIFLRDRSGRVVAVAVGNGTILWRSESALEPLLALADSLIGARITGPNSLQVIIVAAADGREIRSSRAVCLPDWIRLTGDHPDFDLEAEEGDGRIRIRWAARSRYRGGAPPSARIVKGAAKDATGLIEVDAQTADVLQETLRSESSTAAEEDRGARTRAAAGAHEAGGLTFQLLARDVTATRRQLLLRAVDDAGHTAWETVIDEGPPARPKPLRQ